MTLYAGLMSGTSLDGIDAALVRFDGEEERPRGFELLSFRTRPYDGAARARLRHATEGGDAASLCELDFDLGRWLGDAVRGLLEEAAVDPEEVRAVGSHGQTVWHRPPESGRGTPESGRGTPAVGGRDARHQRSARPGRGDGSTLQLGRAAVIAERCGIPVVSDFRARDMAAGGHGAPLTAYTDRILFTGPEARAIQNIGGMANVTVLPPADSDARPAAFDTGPGIALLDAAVERLTEGELAYDEDGRLAARGSVVEPALAEWLEDPFFAEAPPRSTGRERFSRPRLERWLDEHGLDAADAAATLVELTARTIFDGFRWIELPVESCYLCGGGARHPVLARRLEELLAPRSVRGLESLGMDPDAREAVAFALLARQHDLGFAANAPWATGAEGPRRLGSWTPA